MAAFAIILVGLVGVIGLVVLMGLIRGFVLSYLWQWFIVPFGVIEIDVIHAWGISILVGMLTYEQPYQGPPEEAKGKLFGQLLAPFVVLFAGYILKGFM